jgi:hypothetical protein
MRKVFINLNQTTDGIIPNGWTASVAIAHGAQGQNQIAIGDSIIYNTKEQAWEYRDKEIKAGRMPWTSKHDKEKKSLEKQRKDLDKKAGKDGE